MRGSPLVITCPGGHRKRYNDFVRTGQTKDGTTKMGRLKITTRYVTRHEIRCRFCGHHWWSFWEGAESLPVETVS